MPHNSRCTTPLLTLPTPPSFLSPPATFAAIYDHYFPRVYNYVRYRVRDAEAADDIASQVLERALINIGGNRSERAPFAVWPSELSATE
jgi:hypothetical protein